MRATVPPARHILSYAQTLDGGGVERALFRLTADWLEAGRRVTLVIGCIDGPLAAELPPGADLIWLRDPGRLALTRALPAHIRAARPDVLFCPGNFYTLDAAWARLRLGRDCPPIVAKVSNSLDRADHVWPVSWGYRGWLASHRRFIDRSVAMSPAMAQSTRAMTGMAAARIATIPNPPARPLPHVAHPPLPAGRFLLGVGRLEPQKRWERLIAAFARIADRDLQLVILGDGSQRAALEALVAKSGLIGRVHLPGHTPDPIPAYGRAALTVLVSDYEGVPGMLREALAEGCPVVTTDSSVAVHEIVHAPELGTIVPRDDPPALLAALEYWLAPERARPAPVPPPGLHSAADYLAVFDELVAARQA
jgi:glycosyltransferase involved in cell wall biosynthesis